MRLRAATLIAATAMLGSMAGLSVQAQVLQRGSTTTAISPSSELGGGADIDFAHAKPLPLPAARVLAHPNRNAVNQLWRSGGPGASAGGFGTGVQSPERLAPEAEITPQSGATPEEFGTSGQPFTTSEASAYGNRTTSYYPFRAAGKLFFKIGSSSYLCSASLIKPGIVVTAAHCVANYGASQFYSGWTYVPAYSNGAAPYGKWTSASATVLTVYYNGTDNCAQYGVICPDDMAVITLAPKNGAYPGTTTGWFGYGWNGYGYNSSSQALITQLGYPVDLDGGLLMQRTDSQGFTSSSLSNNTIIGSLMTGGSSGGPWVVNLGAPPALSGGDSFGTYASHNVVVGVTSWGYIDLTVKQQGAAPFTSGNISVLVNVVCTATPGAC